MLFLFLGNLVIKPATTPLLSRFGFRNVLIWATIGAALSMALEALLTQSTPIAAIIALLFFSGVTRSVGFTAYNTIAFADIPDADMTDANTLASTVQQLAASYGVAIGAVALTVGQPIAGWFNASGTVAEFQVAFAIIALLTLVPVVEALMMSRSAGENIRPARRAKPDTVVD